MNHFFIIIARALILLLGLITASSETLPAAEPAKVRLFILSGQSNMDGVNPDLSFTPTIKKAFPNDEIIVVKFSVSGTPIAAWWRSDPKEPRAGHYKTLFNRVQTAINGKTIHSAAFVWMQGERDAKTAQSGTYLESLQGLIKCVRDDLKLPNTVVVLGRLTDHLKGTPHWDKVREIQEKFSTNDPRADWVDTDDLNGPNNDLHCTQEGFTQLGNRFASKAAALLQKP